jgi:hypothetical protein
LSSNSVVALTVAYCWRYITASTGC